MVTLSLQRSPDYGAAGQLPDSKHHHWASLTHTHSQNLLIFLCTHHMPSAGTIHTMGTERNRAPISSLPKMPPPSPKPAPSLHSSRNYCPPPGGSLLQSTGTVEKPPATGCPALPCSVRQTSAFSQPHSDCDL